VMLLIQKSWSYHSSSESTNFLIVNEIFVRVRLVIWAKVKVKVKLSFSLTKYHTMKTCPVLKLSTTP
jgi:hypothetical protein